MCVGGGDLVFVDETIWEPLSGTLAGKGCIIDRVLSLFPG